MADTGGVSSIPLRVSPETVLAGLAVVCCLAGSRARLKWLGVWEHPLARLARRPRLSYAAVVAAPLVLRALLLPFYPIPDPHIHDEFAFLLGADTFAHGRLSNPVHPMTVHFESMHILSRPSYASAFPIAQSAALALGQAAVGQPWFGVWASAGLMAVALLWMLRGWLPPRWALLGALLGVLRFGVAGYWMNSYWGGFLAAAAGALVLGALPRLAREPSWKHALPAGFGLALLANTRPVEGAWFAFIAGVALWILRSRSSWGLGAVARRILPALGIVLLPTAAAMGFYFARVTGSAYLPPYLLYRSTRTQAPHFISQQPRTAPRYNNAEMSHFYLSVEMHDYLEARGRPFRTLFEKAAAYWRFYLGPLFTLALFSLPALWRAHGRTLFGMAAAFSLILWAGVWHNPHYAAPATGLILLIVLLALRHLRASRKTRFPGLALARAIPLGCVALLLVQVTAGPGTAAQPHAGWRWPSPAGEPRESIRRSLMTQGGQHLVLVRYSPWHDVGNEWVYNGADPDSAPVVWARELDPSSNAALIRYYGGRRIWLVQPDEPRVELTPYSEAPPRPMRFVAVGAPGIPVLRDPEQVRLAVLRRAGAAGPELSCDVWNYYFTAETGVAPPDPRNGCYASDRSERVPLDSWFQWLLRQR